MFDVEMYLVFFSGILFIIKRLLIPAIVKTKEVFRKTQMYNVRQVK